MNTVSDKYNINIFQETAKAVRNFYPKSTLNKITYNKLVPIACLDPFKRHLINLLSLRSLPFIDLEGERVTIEELTLEQDQDHTLVAKTVSEERIKIEEPVILTDNPELIFNSVKYFNKITKYLKRLAIDVHQQEACFINYEKAKNEIIEIDLEESNEDFFEI